MVARYIVNFPVLNAPPPTPVGLPGGPMMLQFQIRKTLRNPSQHVRLRFVDEIRTGTHPESAERVPTFPTVYFHAASHVEYRMCFRLLHSIGEVVQHTTSDANLGICRKFFYGAGKIVWLKGKIPIELAHEVPVPHGQGMKTVIKRFNDSRAPLAVAAIPAMHHADPGMLCGRLVGNRAGLVLGTVVNDHPLRWANRLTDHALEDFR